ncbi:hypothetical protein GCM10023174_04750 [Chelativorans composti]|uniref:Integrase n=1 Tax=Chelativorans composti TaxID=768533 RepID=A0ABW5DHN0_9HYPH
MALPSYLTRRDGRYYLQIRFSRPLAQLSGVSLYRVSLRTGDYRKARQKLTEFLSWILRMNESINFVDLFQKNVVELRQYLSDQLPISEERLHARLHYEEMLKNLRRRALARDCDPEMIAPEFTILFKRFVAQNVEAEGWLRRIENIRHYEQGRADMQTAIALGVIPQGFGMGLGQPPAGVPSIPLPTPFSTVMPSNPLGVPGVELHAAASPKDEDRAALVWEERKQEQDSGPQQAHEPQAQTTALRFSEALALFEEDDIRNGGNADARALVLLVVQFIIDKMDDPLLVEFDKEAAARIDAMLPDIPDRKNIPREHTVSLAARYDYARKHGWAGLKRLTEARLKNGYHNALSRFFGWLIEQKLYPFEK